MLKLETDYKKRIQKIRGSNRLNQIIEYLFVSPVLQITPLSKRYAVSYPTAKDDISKLIKTGILVEIPETYPKGYFAPEIYKITYDD